MTVHYHGTPITPLTALYQLTGRHFCVSYARPETIRRAHDIGQSVMLDNGAYTAWRQGRPVKWQAYYAWCDRWLDYPTTWAVIPDVIDAGEQLQDALLREWPHGHRGSPVWHMDESLERLIRLTETWPRVCIGSTSEYAVVMSDQWQRRMDETWDALMRSHVRAPAIHMLRGMRCSGSRWPFASVDSADIARNHNRPQHTPRAMADRWDAMQCPGAWIGRPRQMEIAV